MEHIKQNFNLTYDCSYQNIRNLHSDNISEPDITLLENSVYRNDLLNIFNLTTYNGKHISDLVDSIFHFTKSNSSFIEYFKHIDNDDHHTALYHLFSFDYLYLSHKCISDLLEKKIVDSNNHINMLQLLQNKL